MIDDQSEAGAWEALFARFEAASQAAYRAKGDRLVIDDPRLEAEVVTGLSRSTFEAVLGAPARTVTVDGVTFVPADEAARLIEKLAKVEAENEAFRATGHVLEDNLAQVTAERDNLARKVEALSEPRVFNVAGLIEGDLAERYTALRAAHDTVTDAVPDNWRETGAPSIEAHIVDLIAIAVSFMERLASALDSGPFKGWHPANNPAEFVFDAVNRITDAEQLVADAQPSVRLVNDWATWRDASLYAFADAIIHKYPTNKPTRDRIVDALDEIRTVARKRLGDDGFTIPPTYDEAARARAAEAVRQRASAGEVKETFVYHLDNPPTIADLYGATVDAVATALGMRRAEA